MPIQIEPEAETSELHIVLSGREKRALVEIAWRRKFPTLTSVLEFAFWLLLRQDIQFYIDSPKGKVRIDPNPSFFLKKERKEGVEK